MDWRRPALKASFGRIVEFSVERDFDFSWVFPPLPRLKLQLKLETGEEVLLVQELTGA